jgi:hypothetical protein
MFIVQQIQGPTTRDNKKEVKNGLFYYMFKNAMNKLISLPLYFIYKMTSQIPVLLQVLVWRLRKHLTPHYRDDVPQQQEIQQLIDDKSGSSSVADNCCKIVISLKKRIIKWHMLLIQDVDNKKKCTHINKTTQNYLDDVNLHIYIC